MSDHLLRIDSVQSSFPNGMVLTLDQMELPLYVRCAGRDAEGVNELARNLMADILLVDVDDARPAVTSATQGAKSGEVVAIGALVVTVAPAVVAGLVDVMVSWLRRQSRDVEIEVDGTRFRGPVTEAQRDELVAALLRRLDSRS